MASLKQLKSGVVGVIRDASLSELLAEYAEVGLDYLLEEGVAKDIPGVSTLRAVVALPAAVSDRLLLHKLQRFLEALSAVSAKDRAAMVERLEVDPDYGRTVGAHVVDLLSRVESDRKPAMVGFVFRAYAEGSIGTRDLHRLCVAIERIPVHEIPQVRTFAESEPSLTPVADEVTLNQLVSAGLAHSHSAYGGALFKPTTVCEVFIRLGLDRVDG